MTKSLFNGNVRRLCNNYELAEYWKPFEYQLLAFHHDGPTKISTVAIFCCANSANAMMMNGFLVCESFKILSAMKINIDLDIRKFSSALDR